MKINRLIDHFLKPHHGPPSSCRSYAPEESSFAPLITVFSGSAAGATLSAWVLSWFIPIESFHVRFILFGAGLALLLYLNHRVLVSEIRARAVNLSLKDERKVHSLVKNLFLDLKPGFQAYLKAEKDAQTLEKNGESADAIWSEFQERYGFAYAYFVSLFSILVFSSMFFGVLFVSLPQKNLISLAPFMFIVWGPLLLVGVAFFRLGPIYWSPVSPKNAPGAFGLFIQALTQAVFYDPAFVLPSVFQHEDDVHKRRFDIFGVFAVFSITLALAAMFFPLSSLFFEPGTSPVVHSPHLPRRPEDFDPDLNLRVRRGESIDALIEEQRATEHLTVVSSFGGADTLRRRATANDREKNIRDLITLKRNQEEHIRHVNTHPTYSIFASFRQIGTEHSWCAALDLGSLLVLTYVVPMGTAFLVSVIFIGEPLRVIHEQFTAKRESQPEYLERKNCEERLAMSGNAEERDSLVFAFHATTGAPMGRSLHSTNQVTLLTGGPNERKSSTAQSINKREVEYIAKYGGSVYIIDMKGDLSYAYWAKDLAETHGLPFKFLSSNTHHATHGWNLPASSLFRELPLANIEDIFGTGLALSHGLGHGPGFWGDTQKTAIGEAFYDGRIRSFRDLYDYLADRKNYPSERAYDNADHARMVVRAMAIPHLANVTEREFGKDVSDAQYSIEDPLKGGVFVFHLPGSAGNVSRYLGKLLLKTILMVKTFKQDTSPCFLTIDELQEMEAAEEFKTVIHQGRAWGIRATLTCQHASALGEETLDHLKNCITARAWFSPSTDEEFNEIAAFNPRVLEENVSYTPDGIVTSGMLSTYHTVDDFIEVNDTHADGILVLRSDRSPLSKWGSFAHRARFPFCIPKAQYESYQKEHWVEKEELPGSILPSEHPEFRPPRRVDVANKNSKSSSNASPPPVQTPPSEKKQPDSKEASKKKNKAAKKGQDKPSSVKDALRKLKD